MFQEPHADRAAWRRAVWPFGPGDSWLEESEPRVPGACWPEQAFSVLVPFVLLRELPASLEEEVGLSQGRGSMCPAPACARQGGHSTTGVPVGLADMRDSRMASCHVSAGHGPAPCVLTWPAEPDSGGLSPGGVGALAEFAV